jgi:hypothetical protein
MIFIVLRLLLVVEILDHEFQLAVLHHDVHGVLVALDGQTDKGVEVVLELPALVGEVHGLVHLHGLQTLDASDAVEGRLYIGQTGHHVGLIVGTGQRKPAADDEREHEHADGDDGHPFLVLVGPLVGFVYLLAELELVSQRLDAFCYLGIFLCLGAFEYLHSLKLSVVQIFVFEGTPVGDEQSVRIVLCPWHVLNLAHGDDGAFEVTAASLDELRTEVLELSVVLVELYGIALNGADSGGRNDVGVEAVLFHGLFLLHRRAVSHVEGLAKRPLDVVVVGRQVEEVLVEELDMRLGFHHEVGFLQAAFGEEGDVTV